MKCVIRGAVRRGNVRSGNCSFGELSFEELSVGEMSVGGLSGYQVTRSKFAILVERIYNIFNSNVFKVTCDIYRILLWFYSVVFKS